MTKNPLPESGRHPLRQGQALVLVVICCGAVIIDQIAKILVVSYMTPGGTVVLIPKLLSLTLLYNRGMAFGQMQGHTWVLSVISLGASVVLPVIIRKTLRQKGRFLPAVGLTLILSGAIGNLIDRLFRSKGVVDYIDFYIGSVDNPVWRWFPFNFADSVICIGVVLYLYTSWKCDRLESQKQPTGA